MKNLLGKARKHLLKIAERKLIDVHSPKHFDVTVKPYPMLNIVKKSKLSALQERDDMCDVDCVLPHKNCWILFVQRPCNQMNVNNIFPF